MRCIALCLSVAVLIGCAFPASAQSDVHNTKIVSGPGGGPFDDACRPGDVLVGFNYISGKAMNRLAGVCQAQNNGVLVGANYGLATHGEDPGNGTLLGGAEFHGKDFPRCPPGQAINEMRVWLDKYNEVDKVAASCTPLLSDRHVQGVYLGEMGGLGEAVSSEHITCGPADIAIGIIGRSGSQIDGVGLKCGTFQWRPVATGPQPPVTPPPVTPPPTSPTYVKVIADAQIFPQPAPPAGIQSKGDLAAATDQVVLKKVGAPQFPNWYELSWPNNPAGDDWVYSAPPNTGDFTSLDPTTLAAAIAALGGGH